MVYVGLINMLPGLSIAVANNPQYPSVASSFQRMARAAVESTEGGLALRMARGFGPVGSAPFLEKVQDVSEQHNIEGWRGA